MHNMTMLLFTLWKDYRFISRGW